METIQEAILICLRPDCPHPRYIADALASPHRQCSRYIHSIEALLNKSQSNHSNHQYPPSELGQQVKKRLWETQSAGKEGYLDIILDDFRETVNKILEGLRKDLTTIYPLDHLQRCYQQVFSLQQVRLLVESKSSSSLITEQLRLMELPHRVNQLRETNKHLDDINNNLCQIVIQLNGLVTAFKKSVLVVRKDLAGRARQNLSKNYSPDQIVFGVMKTTYAGGKDIRFQDGWIVFPSCSQQSFKPWVYSQRGFSTGVHKLKISVSVPLDSTNCGVAIIKQSDLHTYPYSTYKSLFDRVSRQFKLTNGVDIQGLTRGVTEIVVTIDLNEKEAKIRDRDNRCEYICSLKDSTVYYFAIVGASWRVKIMHLS